MNLLWLDVETVGLMGPLMRIQWAINDGPIQFIDYLNFNGNQPLINLLNSPDTLLIAYNAGFDVFHLYRHFDSGRPFACRVLDLQVPAMLYGPFKNFAFMKGKARSVARVRRIPRKALEIVRDRVLAKLRPHVPNEFQILVGVHEVKGQPELCSLSFSVDGRSTLKAHARFYGAPTLSLADNWPLVPRELEKTWLKDYDPEVYRPYEQACAAVLSTPGHPFHVYCSLDIWFLRLLANKLVEARQQQTGENNLDIESLIDHHSDCVHTVAYTRYAGFEFDRPTLERTRRFYESKVNEAQEALGTIDLKSANQRLAALRQLDPLVGASNRKVLEILAGSNRPSRYLAQSMLGYGKYRQRLLQVEKILESRTDRAYPSLRVMGTATGRMAGEAGLNWQGIAQAQKNHQGEEVGIRAALKIGMGGDFEALEVTIAAAAYQDTQLQADLDAGIDLHSMVASMSPEAIRAGMSYEDTWKGYKNHESWAITLRKKGKGCVFATIYGAQKTKISEVLQCTEQEADRFLDTMFTRYRGIGAFRQQAEKRFQTADVDEWTKDSVRRMDVEVVDLLGFVRRFDFEKAVAASLWELGSSGISTGLVGSVVRTKEKGGQSIDNAIKSALLGSAIAIQQAVCRQACNSPVQSTGAGLTKILMAELWNKLRMPVLNIHDELISPAGLSQQCTELVTGFLNKYRGLVKSLNIEMKSLERWSEK